MYHFVKMSSKYIGGNIDHLDEEELHERLEAFSASGDVSIILDDPEDLESLGIDPDDVQITVIEK